MYLNFLSFPFFVIILIFFFSLFRRNHRCDKNASFRYTNRRAEKSVYESVNRRNTIVLFNISKQFKIQSIGHRRKRAIMEHRLRLFARNWPRDRSLSVCPWMFVSLLWKKLKIQFHKRLIVRFKIIRFKYISIAAFSISPMMMIITKQSKRY